MTAWMEMPEVQKKLGVLRIIVLALVGGVVCFLAVVLAMNEGSFGDTRTGALVLLAVVAVASALLLAPVLASTTRRAGLGGSKAPDAAAAMTAYVAGTILGAAVSEGACLLALVAYMLEDSRYALVAAGIGILRLVSFYPTDAAVRHWLESNVRA